jgi:hypothetical protein
MPKMDGPRAFVGVADRLTVSADEPLPEGAAMVAGGKSDLRLRAKRTLCQ